MELREFSPLTTDRARHWKPSIRLNQRVGVFVINPAASALMHLKDGDQVVLHQDKNVPDNWYLEHVKKGGFTIRRRGPEVKGLGFNAKSLAIRIAESVGMNVNTGGMKVSAEPVIHEGKTLWTLITASLKQPVV